jgi:hypothetical protein
MQLVQRGVLLHTIIRPAGAPANDSSYPDPSHKRMTYGVFDDEADASAYAHEHGFSGWSFSYVQMVKGEAGIIPVPVTLHCPVHDSTLRFDSREEAENSEANRGDCWQSHVITEVAPA